MYQPERRIDISIIHPKEDGFDRHDKLIRTCRLFGYKPYSRVISKRGTDGMRIDLEIRRYDYTPVGKDRSGTDPLHLMDILIRARQEIAEMLFRLAGFVDVDCWQYKPQSDSECTTTETRL